MITIIKPGLFTTIQDQGRWGYQAYGMPVAGAMDRYAYRTANVLVGNACDAAVIEMTMLGATFHFDQGVWASICGADMQGTLNGENITNWSSFYIPADSELSFGYATTGCRSYLAVHGGIDVPLVLGSRSTYTRAGVGGADGKALQALSTLVVGEQHASVLGQLRTLPDTFIPQYASQLEVRVLLGPQDDLFTEEGIATFFNGEYTISDEADRMGYRLEGPPIKHIGTADIISDALCQGAIQVPGHGMPIVMMADRGTTGGYAKIGTVIGPDLTLLAQAKPGDSVRFIQCCDEKAVAALQHEHDSYMQIETWMEEPQHKYINATPFKITISGYCYDVQVEEVIK